NRERVKEKRCNLMVTTHIFVVDENTFPIHLEYMFAGTGAKEKEEHIGLLADIKRVRVGDNVIFYLQRVGEKEGGFFGLFKVKDHKPLVFKEPGGEYLFDELKKKLIYRTFIEPFQVYKRPVTEWEALDVLPEKSTDILWSLIYRKLRALRGCTQITLEEAERLIALIRNNNNGKTFTSKIGYSYDSEEGEIIEGYSKKYTGKIIGLDTIKFLVEKYNKQRAFEVELQAFFTENAGENIIKDITGDKNEIIWLGNEVYCGVGMQKIDVFTITESINQKLFRIIELKDEFVLPTVIFQIKKYVEWTKQHMKGSNNNNIQPFVIAKKIPELSTGKIKLGKFEATLSGKKETIFFKKIIDAFKEFNKKKLALPIRYFEYEIFDSKNPKIIFNEINY
ncbi:MAG: hypothetical protein RMJ17_01075, partial [Candidatus Aenigmarchaeota archaeon]|nr:EVE domain-containing protein [Candidatus Aenigmarchaeota archaeon]MDW8149178.1 hypothetical protein [Candidatus Aenigmarchaeota archaeon]